MVKRARLLLVALVLAAAAGWGLADDSPVKRKEDLDSKLTHLGRDLASKLDAAAKKLESISRHAGAWDLSVLALELDPECAGARARLGFKRAAKEKPWESSGATRPRDDLPLIQGKDDILIAFEADVLKLYQKTAADLAPLAKRAKAGGLEADARRVAGLALDADAQNAVARGILGHTKKAEEKGEVWLSPREVALEDALAKCVADAKLSAPRHDRLDSDVVSVIQIQPFARADSEHVAVFATTASGETDLEKIARIVEGTYVACRAWLAGDASGFKIPGAPAGEATGSARPAPDFRPYIAIVAKEEHAAYVDRIVKNPEEAAGRKKFEGFITNVKLPSGRARVAEQCGRAACHAEVASHAIVQSLVEDTFATTAIPDWAMMGLRISLGGRIVGRNDVIYVSMTGTGGSARRTWKGGSFVDFRALVRPMLATTLEGELRSLFAKHLNEFDGDDVVLSFALVDWALETRRGDLIAFLSSLKQDERPLVTFEHAFKKDVDAVERELRAWAREEY